jgi:hypothetical protein
MLVLIGVLPAVGATEPVPDAALPVSEVGERWVYAAIDCPEQCPQLAADSDVAEVLGVLRDGYAVILFFEDPRFETRPSEELKALRVIFVARNAHLEGIATMLNFHLHQRVKFKPRSLSERVTLDLQRVPLAEVLSRLGTFGEIQVLPPSAPPGGLASASTKF